ncbi:MAG: hypothetical protein L6R40_000392 [Gallowayella cf. fulva]|nr:MAG: hypothetical protein L6R40_000392 [Xanthomendoza cf. fulva]
MAPISSVLLALCAPTLIWSSALFPRAQTVSVCNADNCLRQIRSNSVKASPYCTGYLGQAHPKIYAGPIAGGGGYVTRKDTPYTPYDAEQKRGLYETSQPTPTPFLEPRQAQFPTFASQCQGNADRLSSACTCLIGYTPGTTTIARTATGVYTTIGVCDPRNNYGLRQNYNGGPEYRGQYPNPRFSQRIRSDIKDVQAAGLVEIYDPYNGFFDNTYGLGLCAFLVYSDE